MLNVLSKKKFVPVSCVLYGLSIMWLTSVMSVRIFPVPMTMQTCGMQVIAFLMSPVQAFYAVGSWLMAGAVGVPCFAGGKCGIDALFGPSSGYFLGMLLSAPLMSFLMRKYRNQNAGFLPNASFQSLFSVGFLGVILVLSMGYIFLSMFLGAHKAWCVGVKPFFLTDVLKAVFGTLLMKGLMTLREK